MKKVDSQDQRRKKRQLSITLIIVLLSFLIRLWRLDIPHDWSFDEVYHALSAEAYALNDPRGYEWWNPSPKDLAYEWLHPPLGKLFMAASIKLFAKPYIPESKAAPVDGATTFAWRFPGTIFAALTVWLLIVFGTKLFNRFWIGAVAGILYGLDGLSFVQSRTGMNDVYITFFVVLTFYFLFVLIKEYPAKKLKHLFLLGLAAGLSASTKWTGFYAVAVAFVFGTLFLLKKRDWATFFMAPLFLGLVPVMIYFLSYAQWWFQGHTLQKFYELHQQIWWYQTGLKATHDYQSQAWTWPFLYRPVWFYVNYQDMIQNGKKVLHIGNIYTMGHPLIWWAGLLAMLYVVYEWIIGIWDRLEGTIKGHIGQLFPITIVLVGYFSMFLPWAFSPRIMFMYHYLPAVPFLCLILAYALGRLKEGSRAGSYASYAYLGLVILLFIYFYPHWTAWLIPQKWVNQYFWLPSWK